MNSSTQNSLSILENELTTGKSSDLEKLARAILEEATGITVRIASSGTQSGADAGALSPTRSIRVEAKRYKESTPLSSHEVVGKVAEAFQDNPLLEAWVLVSTKIVSEQATKALRKYSEEHGIPVFILDWAGTQPILAMLCASCPELVRNIYGNKAAKAAEAIAASSCKSNALNNLRKDFELWSTGWAMTSLLCKHAAEKILSNEAESLAYFRQNLAIADSDSKNVQRKEIYNMLNIKGVTSGNNNPLLIIGDEGRGKSWILATWLYDQLQADQFIIYCSSSEFRSLSDCSVDAVLAHALSKRTGAFNSTYWNKRISHLLSAPRSSQPLIWLIIDGLNETPSIDWSGLFLDAQRDVWQSRLRLIASCRTQYYKDKLQQGRSWVHAPVIVEVPAFTPDERDTALKLQNIEITKLTKSVLELATVPRICRLVVRMSAQLEGVDDITYERLLFEYGKRFDLDARTSLSDDIWHAFLKELATVTSRNLTYARKTQVRDWIDFRESEAVDSALNDIADGNLIKDNGKGVLEFDKNLVLVANGIALWKLIETALKDDEADIPSILAKELEPLGGVDERPRIVWAALAATFSSDLVEEKIEIVVAALLVEGIISQNMDEDDERSLLSYTKSLPSGYLYALSILVRANRLDEADILTLAILSAGNNVRVRDAIIKSATDWVRIIPLNIESEKSKPEEQRSFTNNFIRWFGKVPEAGNIDVLDAQLSIEGENNNHSLSVYALRLMQVCSLSGSRIFWRRYGVASLLDNYHLMNGYMFWLVRLNRIDYDKTCETLGAESNYLSAQKAPSGADQTLPNQAAANLLWPIGDDYYYTKARKLVPKSDGWDYLLKDQLSPNTSVFGLFRCHVESVLAESEQSTSTLISRASKWWSDPELALPLSFIKKIEKYAKSFSFNEISSRMSRTRSDYDLSVIYPALARSSSIYLSRFSLRKLKELGSRAGEEWVRLAAFDISDLWLIVTEKDCQTIIYELGRDDIGECDKRYLECARSSLQMLASKYHSSDIHVKNLIEDGIESITEKNINFFSPITAKASESLLAVVQKKNDSKADWMYVNLLAHTNTPISESVAEYLFSLAYSEQCGLRRLVLYVISVINNKTINTKFSATGWSWKDIKDDAERLHGSRILISVEPQIALSDILPRVAPWQLPALAYRRNSTDEIRLIAKTISGLLSVRDEVPSHPFDENINIEPGLFYAPFRLMELVERDSNQISSGLDSHFDKMEKAKQAAIDLISDERDKGLPFYNAWIDTKYIVTLLESAPEELASWLDYIDINPFRFAQKVRRAAGFYLGLCEYLLTHDPECGVKLWRFVNDATASTNFINDAGLDKKILMVFEAPDSEFVFNLKNELWDISKTNTDLKLLNIIKFAESSNNSKWLDEKIEADISSKRPWRQDRALFSSAFRLHPVLDREVLSRDYGLYSHRENIEIQTQKIASRAVWQRYWLEKYMTEVTSEDAYAAFILFIEVADSRWLLILNDLKSQGIKMPDDRARYLKMRHGDINKVADKINDDLKGTFLSQRICGDLWPWLCL